MLDKCPYEILMMYKQLNTYEELGLVGREMVARVLVNFHVKLL